MRTRRLISHPHRVRFDRCWNAMWSASTIEREGDADANVIEDSGSAAGSAGGKEEGGQQGSADLCRAVSRPSASCSDAKTITSFSA